MQRGKIDLTRTCAPPLDYAWKEMVTFAEVLEEEPWTREQEQQALAELRRQRSAASKAQQGAAATDAASTTEAGEKSEAKTDKARNSKKKHSRADAALKISSVKLNNNLFESWEGFADAIEHVISEKDCLDMLDLSFNKLSTIDDTITRYQTLGGLYLHGNKISSFRELRKLKKLPNLRKLSLHGNPIEEKKGYRNFVIALIPTLKQLDFTPITALDRKNAEVQAERKRRQVAARRQAMGY